MQRGIELQAWPTTWERLARHLTIDHGWTQEGIANFRAENGGKHTAMEHKRQHRNKARQKIPHEHAK